MQSVKAYLTVHDRSARRCDYLRSNTVTLDYKACIRRAFLASFRDDDTFVGEPLLFESCQHLLGPSFGCASVVPKARSRVETIRWARLRDISNRRMCRDLTGSDQDAASQETRRPEMMMEVLAPMEMLPAVTDSLAHNVGNCQDQMRQSSVQ